MSRRAVEQSQPHDVATRVQVQQHRRVAGASQLEAELARQGGEVGDRTCDDVAELLVAGLAEVPIGEKVGRAEIEGPQIERLQGCPESRLLQAEPDRGVRKPLHLPQRSDYGTTHASKDDRSGKDGVEAGRPLDRPQLPEEVEVAAIQLSVGRKQIGERGAAGIGGEIGHFGVGSQLVVRG